MSPQVPRLLKASTYLASLAVRSPREALQVGRSIASSLLDRRFDERSPIPWLPEAVSQRLRRRDVLLARQDQLRHGNQDLEGLINLVCLAAALEAKTLFEIGTFNGLTALTLAANLPEARVNTLDLPHGDTPALRVFSSDPEHLRVKFERRVYEGHPAGDRVVQHYGDSARFDFSPFAGRCHLIYIDGAHSYEYVESDTATAFRIVSPKAAIVWDDYWRRTPDVARYLDQRRDLKLFRIPRTRLVVWFTDEARRALGIDTGSDG